MITVGILLAAGRSSRFGAEDKLLAPFRGVPLVCHAASALRQSSLSHLIAVVRRNEVARSLDGFEIHRLNADAEQSESLRQGIILAEACGADRAVIVLGDMPFVTSNLVTKVVSAATQSRPAATTDGYRITPPACFPKAVFPDLVRVTGDEGGRAMLRDLPQEALVRAPSHLLIDIDTQNDLSAAACEE